MSKFTQLRQLELDMFDIIEGLHKALFVKRIDDYKMYLSLMDEVNEEYKELSGKYYLDPMRCLGYYENLWEL